MSVEIGEILTWILYSSTIKGFEAPKESRYPEKVEQLRLVCGEALQRNAGGKPEAGICRKPKSLNCRKQEAVPVNCKKQKAVSCEKPKTITCRKQEAVSCEKHPQCDTTDIHAALYYKWTRSTAPSRHFDPSARTADEYRANGLLDWAKSSEKVITSPTDPSQAQGWPVLLSAIIE